MSGNLYERTTEPTLADHVTRIRNLNYQLQHWSFHPELGDQLQADLEHYRRAFPEAASVYDAQQIEVHQRIMALGQRIGEVTVPKS